MVDAFPDHGALQRKRGQALILCDWQSGVRANCLCSWTFAMFKDQLWPTIKFPVKIKVASDRPEGVTDCAVDTKLSSYNVNYYYTFLAEEGARTVKDYLEERQKQGWKPKDSDPVFVTHGTVIEENGRPLNAQHVVDVVKSAAKQIGIDPSKIWTHCLRKAFRKTLYSSGVDPDIAEALMGHKLGASRGSYFDYHDIKFAEDNYKRASWTRLGVERFQQMENELAELRKIRVEHEALVTNGQSKASEIQDLKVQVLSLASTLKLWEELMARSGIKLKPTRKDEK
jgi:hypothetical protein